MTEQYNAYYAYKKEMKEANITQETVIALRNIHHMYDDISEENLKFLDDIIEMLE